MTWPREDLVAFQRTSPADASDALVERWVDYLEALSRDSARPEWQGGHVFDQRPLASNVRQMLIDQGERCLPVDEFDDDRDDESIRGNFAHNLAHKLGMKHPRGQHP